MCVAAMAADALELVPLQAAAVELVRSLFGAYPGHRAAIVSDVVAFVAHAQQARKASRRFATMEPRVEMQVGRSVVRLDLDMMLPPCKVLLPRSPCQSVGCAASPVPSALRE